MLAALLIIGVVSIIALNILGHNLEFNSVERAIQEEEERRERNRAANQKRHSSF